MHRCADGSFARRLLAWWDTHGRKNLPWQRERTPYRVWISEIMLQQTQVGTVVPYFERFMTRFPTVETLARADLDEVLHLWSGLGYYARARNLHRAAGLVVRNHGGVFPDTVEAIRTLPGIGRSTAAAIVAQSHGRRAAILDANVKRVLARRHRVAGAVSSSATLDELWRLAESQTPAERVADYTQAIMDLGATVCRRTRPRCPDCPVRADCQGHATGDPERYPEKAPRRKRRLERSRFLRGGRSGRRLPRRAATAARHLGRSLVAAGTGRGRARRQVPGASGHRRRSGRSGPEGRRVPAWVHPLRPRRRADLRASQDATGRGSRRCGAVDRPWRSPAGYVCRCGQARRRDGLVRRSEGGRLIKRQRDRRRIPADTATYLREHWPIIRAVGWRGSCAGA